MKGLLLKDFYNASGQLKLYVLYPILGAFLSYTQESLSMMVMFSSIMIVAIPISSMSYDDMADFTPLALTLPLTRKQIVLAKYVLSLIVTLIVMVCYLVMLFIMLQIFGNDYFGTNFKEQSLICVVACFSVNAINCIMIPMLYRFGSEKGRMFLFIIPFVVIALVYFSAPLIDMLPYSIATSLLYMLNTYGFYLGAAFALLLEVCGITISNHIMEKKEF